MPPASAARSPASGRSAGSASRGSGARSAAAGGPARPPRARTSAPAPAERSPGCAAGLPEGDVMLTPDEAEPLADGFSSGGVRFRLVVGFRLFLEA